MSEKPLFVEIGAMHHRPTDGPEVPPDVRFVSDHVHGHARDGLMIVAWGQPDPANIQCRYVFTGNQMNTAKEAQEEGSGYSCAVENLSFQSGPVAEVGFNGLTDEAVLAVLIDRQRQFQAGPGRSKERACALTHMEEAMLWLHERKRKAMMEEAKAAENAEAPAPAA